MSRPPGQEAEGAPVAAAKSAPRTPPLISSPSNHDSRSTRRTAEMPGATAAPSRIAPPCAEERVRPAREDHGPEARSVGGSLFHRMRPSLP